MKRPPPHSAYLRRVIALCVRNEPCSIAFAFGYLRRYMERYNKSLIEGISFMEWDTRSREP